MHSGWGALAPVAGRAGVAYDFVEALDNLTHLIVCNVGYALAYTLH